MSRRTGWVVLGAVVAAFGLSLVAMPYPKQQHLQHTPTVIGLLALAWAVHARRIDGTSFACWVALLLLHVLGARWIYTFVPYDEWLRAAFGSDTRGWFGWRRNHYDRLVHVAFGVLVVPPTVLFLGRRTGRGVALVGALAGVLALSALYEVFEWGLTVVMNPRRADLYNGQQGDAWDAQKDMALAGAGALVAVLFGALAGRWRATPRG